VVTHFPSSTPLPNPDATGRSCLRLDEAETLKTERLKSCRCRRTTKHEATAANANTEKLKLEMEKSFLHFRQSKVRNKISVH